MNTNTTGTRTGGMVRLLASGLVAAALLAAVSCKRGDKEPETAPPTPTARQAPAAETPTATETPAPSPTPEAEPTPAVEPAAAPPAGDAAKGRETFAAMCATCHGPGGRGDGPAAAGLNPKPRDLTDADYMSGVSDRRLWTTIKSGGAAVGLSPLMPPWGGTLTDDDIADLVAYIRQDLCRCTYVEK